MKLDRSLLMEKAACIRLLVLDVDGVLTDGSVVYDAAGGQIQAFHVHDGLGLKLLERAGINVAIISSRTSGALEFRAGELGIKFVYQGVKDKMAVYEELKNALDISLSETAYVGDDWVDIKMLRHAGLAVVVCNATKPMKDYAHYITTRPGGNGAVREVCDLILRASGRWSEFLNEYASS